jgi:hypothetical protein
MAAWLFEHLIDGADKARRLGSQGLSPKMN